MLSNNKNLKRGHLYVHSQGSSPFTVTTNDIFYFVEISKSLQSHEIFNTFAIKYVEGVDVK